MSSFNDLIVYIQKLRKDPDFDKILYCIKVDDIGFCKLSELVQDSCACFFFSLIISGEGQVENAAKKIKIEKNDFFIYLPGLPMRVNNISKDFEAYTLIIEEQAVLNSSMAGILLQTLCFPISKFNSKITLPIDLFERVNRLMIDCDYYCNSDHILKKESSHITVSLIFADILDYLIKNKNASLTSTSNVNTVISFLRLLIKNFKNKHDISFYADQLNITKTHLSRVIKKTTGDTVIDHVNRMLMMEASWLLRHSNTSIAEISDKLSFSDQSSFCKFFKRYKGFSPLKYRSLNQKG